jgi:hypothetical protein
MIGCIVAWIVVAGKTSSGNGKIDDGLLNALESADSAPIAKKITSKLGITIPFNGRELAGFGLADNVTYSANDLDEARGYTVMRVRPVETSQATRNEVTLESPELRVAASNDAKVWESLQAAPEYKSASKTDIIVKETIKQHKTDQTITASDVETVKIGTNDYRKVTFTKKDEQYAIPTMRREDCYITVQNDRPYVACIKGIRSSNFAAAPLLEQVMTQISYQAPEQAALSGQVSEQDKAAIADSKKDEKVSAEAAKTAKVSSTHTEGLEKSAIFAASAQAAPATVRVGTLYCANIKLTSGQNRTAMLQLTNACTDKGSSGFIISRDGHIATAGSAVQVTPQQAINGYIINAPDSAQMYDRLSRVLTYLVQSRTIMQTDAEAIIAGTQQRDPDVIDKVNSIASKIPVEDISVTDEKYSYAVQLADQPMTVSDNSNGTLGFGYTDTVVDAELVGTEFDASKTKAQIFQGTMPDNDVAIIKAKKNLTYPTLKLASSSTFRQNVPVMGVGVPMYAFGSLQSSQMNPNRVFRVGTSAQQFNSGSSQKISSVSFPSHAGFMGGPVFDETGAVTAFMSYGNLQCPDQKCFGQSAVRDVTGVTTVAKKRNISLVNTSPSSDDWRSGIAEYIKGNYKRAADYFASASSQYPNNYLATKFLAHTKTRINSQSDTSIANTAVDYLKLATIILAICIVVECIALLALKLFSRPQPQTQYGMVAGGNYIDPSQWSQSQSVAGSVSPQPSMQPQAVPQPTAWSPPTNTQYPPQQSTPVSPQPYQQPPVQPLSPQPPVLPSQPSQDQPTNWPPYA